MTRRVLVTNKTNDYWLITGVFWIPTVLLLGCCFNYIHFRIFKWKGCIVLLVEVKTDEMDIRAHMQSFEVARTCDRHLFGRWLHRHLPVTCGNYIYRTKLTFTFYLLIYKKTVLWMNTMSILEFERTIHIKR